MSQHLQVTVDPLEATASTVHMAQLVIAEAHVRQYYKEVKATTQAATGAELIIDGYVSLGQFA
jgi:hypothetical protein